MGNYMYTPEQASDSEEEMLTFSATHVDKMQKKYKRLEQDIKVLQSQLDFKERKMSKKAGLQETCEQLTQQTKKLNNEIESKMGELLEVKSSLLIKTNALVETRKTLAATTTRVKSLTDKLEICAKVKEFSEKDAKLQVARIQALEKQLKSVRKHKKDGEEAFRKEKKQWAGFFDARECHITYILAQYPNSGAISATTKRAFLMEVFDLLEERVGPS